MILIAGEICTDDYMASLFPSLNIRMIKIINFTSLTEVVLYFLSMVSIAGEITTEPYMASQRLSPPILVGGPLLRTAGLNSVFKFSLMYKYLAESKLN